MFILSLLLSISYYYLGRVRSLLGSPFAICTALLISTVNLQILSAEQLNLSVEADSAILVNADTGVVLYEKNAHKLQYPASITKVATALYTLAVYGDKLDAEITAEHDAIAWALKEAKIKSNYTLPAHWLEPDASNIGLKKGEIMSLNDLLHGMLIASGSDASNVIAQYIGGTVPRFMEGMNLYLKELGCKNTNFCNPGGLHHPKHLTTAYDMSIIARQAMKEPIFRDIVRKVRFNRPQTNKQPPTTLVQGNRLLREGKLYYRKAIGIKTGFTSDAQSTLVAAAEHEERTLIAVLIKTKVREQMFVDARKMFEAAFSQTKVQRVLLKGGEQKYVLNHPNSAAPIRTWIEKDLCVDFYPAEEPKLRCQLQWDNFQPPVAKGQRVGILHVTSEEGRLIQTVPVFSVDDVAATWSYRIKKFFSKGDDEEVKINTDDPPVKSQGFSPFWKAAAICAAVVLLILFLLALRRK